VYVLAGVVLENDKPSLVRYMKNKIEKAFRSAFYFALQAIKSNKMLKRLLYDVSNEETLGGLFFHESMVFDKVRMDAYH